VLVLVEHGRGWAEIEVCWNIPREGELIPPPHPLPTPRGWDLGPLAVQWGVRPNPMSGGLWRPADFARVEASHWLLAALLAIAPGTWALRRRRLSRRQRAGCCLACGYDLRAHGAGERCPECGTIRRGAPLAAEAPLTSPLPEGEEKSGIAS
jgi:hypothetical protein